MRIKISGYAFILKVFFPKERKIKWLPAIVWGYVKKPIKNPAE